MKKVIVIIIVLLVILVPTVLFIAGERAKRKEIQVQNGQTTEENELPKNKLTHGENVLYGTDVPMQGNNVSDIIDKNGIIRLDEGAILDFELEEIAKHFPGKEIYYDPENNGGHALFMAHVGDAKEIGGYEKDRFLVQFQHSTRNLDILAVKVDNNWEFPVEDKNSEDFIQFADDKAYIMFDMTKSFIVNYNSVFLEVQQMVLVDKEGNIVIVGGDIIVA